MRTQHRMRAAVVLAAACAASTFAGCSSFPKRSQVTTEPGLTVSGGDGVAVSDPGLAGARPATFADRHPLLYKPREYYDNSGNNTIVKTAAATFVGVPAGIVGELKQIITGTPGATRY